ncbi:MAG: Arc family DNA-binding protein [Roseitalea sp.]|jgi:plasmid stability protein|uniref:FitA-like ribbon-helix-helix domain-containing protein n=1 Tax=Oceaniradius stylonematis TaxID=2184161 RepID=UPI000F3CB75C|nr:Arc family DNA-binding protein [Oceaniradius stylonematis]MBO6552705.1 Arc family DNA-binding protein [Roseitalea sp.]MBO6950374.1 Arc family DNA-binding protein [Rhizobiaceae bacterium]RNC94804.1 MAG: Arc family DNA-binding protein [Oricola sp.]MBO6591637.1 Arc family DNA-binding protein [Roseitalea sp.]MBO6599492.1 Arc family DNA-binding protein [Roseitalea sp.]
MAQIIIRQLPDEVHRALKAQARDHGRSAEAEARAILAKSLNGDERPKAGDMIADIWSGADLTGVDIKRNRTPHEPPNLE